MRRGSVLIGVAAIAAAVVGWWFLGREEAPPPGPSPRSTDLFGSPGSAFDRPAGDPAPAEAPASPDAADSAAVASTPARPPVDALTVTGRVVDERRVPVPGASVSVFVPGRPPLAGVAGAEGRFRVAGVPRREGPWALIGVLARAEDGRAGATTVSVGSGKGDEADAGAVVLAPAGSLTVRITDAGAPAAGARVLLLRNFVVHVEGVGGPDGTARFPALPGATWTVLALAAEGGHRGRRDALVEAGRDASVAIELAPARTVEVLVAEKGTGRPVEGATFGLWRQIRSPGTILAGPLAAAEEVPPTDAEGRTRIAGTLPEETIGVHDLRAPGYPPAGPRARWTVKPGETELRIEVAPGHTVRFPVVGGGSPVPPDGAVLELLPMPGAGTADPSGSGRMEGATLVVDDVPPSYWHAIARAPDGSLARLFVKEGEDAGMETSFAPARTVELVARGADGSPAAGETFVLRNQGNNPMGPAVATDGEGRAVFEGLYGGMGLVQACHLQDPTFPYGGKVVGTLDLGKGDGRIEVVLGAPREVLLRVTVDGRPRLPGEFGLVVNGGRVADLREDPEKGELRCVVPLDPGTPGLQVRLSASPYLPATATVQPVPPEGVIAVDVPLRSGGALHLRLLLPEDGQGRPELRRLGEDGTTWARAFIPNNPMMAMAPGPDGLVRLDPLEPGTYRVVDSTTGLSSPPVEVRAGTDPAEVSLDLSRTGWAAGRVDLPEGTDTKEVRVRLEAPGLDTAPSLGQMGPPGTRLWPDGTFKVRVPGDRPVTLRPWHPLLVPATVEGTAEVSGPREGIVLRLVPGARASARLDPVPKATGWSMARNRVLLYRGEPEGPPDAERDAVLEGDRLTFGGFDPGTWNLWIDLQVAAPLVVRGAVLGEAETDLGVLHPRPGGSLRVRILVKEGQAPPRISLFAWRLDEPKYSRGLNSRGEAEPVLEGLGAGRFRVTGGPIMGSPGTAAIEEEMNLDGASERVLTLDLR